MRIVWVGPLRTLPNIGVVYEGVVLYIDEEIANSYIEQGLAKREIVRPKLAAAKKEGDSNDSQ